MDQQGTQCQLRLRLWLQAVVILKVSHDNSFEALQQLIEGVPQVIADNC